MITETYAGIKDVAAHVDSGNEEATLRIVTKNGGQNIVHKIDRDGAVCLLKAASHIILKYGLNPSFIALETEVEE